MTAGKPDILGISGRTAIVSGSTRGVGLAIAAALAAAGANVALNYLVNEEQAKRALARVRERGVKAIAVRADVSSEEDARRLVSEAEAHLGPVDILVNNAHGKIVRAKLPDSGWELHQQHIDAILRGAFNLSRHVVEGMKTRGWGRIVNMGNNMVLQPIQGYSALTSAMGALMGFTRNLASEAGHGGVTVNMVSPGFVLTEETPHMTPAVLKAISDATPMGRLATPDDISGAVLFFCSELGRFVTGANLSVDGGKIMT